MPPDSLVLTPSTQPPVDPPAAPDAPAPAAPAAPAAGAPAATAPGGAAPVSVLGSEEIALELVRLGVGAERARLVPSEEAEGNAVEAEGESGPSAGGGRYLEIKSLAVLAKEMRVVAVVAADAKLDVFKLARHLQLSLTSRRALSRQLRLATPDECVALFGFRPGTVPPLAHRDARTRIVLDSACACTDRMLLAGGGTFGTRLAISPSVIAELDACTISEIASDISQPISADGSTAGGAGCDGGGQGGDGGCHAGPTALVDALLHDVLGTDGQSGTHGQTADGAREAEEEASASQWEVVEVNPWVHHTIHGRTDAAAREAAATQGADDGGVMAAGQAGQGRGGGGAPSEEPRSSSSSFATPPVGRHSAAAEPRFLVDAMMGRLLRWLRVLGVDSLLREDGESLPALFGRARAERRILLTRDRKLAERRDGGAVAVFVVGSDESREQLKEIVSHFGLRLSADEFMMRCSVGAACPSCACPCTPGCVRVRPSVSQSRGAPSLTHSGHAPHCPPRHPSHVCRCVTGAVTSSCPRRQSLLEATAHRKSLRASTSSTRAARAASSTGKGPSRPTPSTTSRPSSTRSAHPRATSTWSAAGGWSHANRTAAANEDEAACLLLGPLWYGDQHPLLQPPSRSKRCMKRDLRWNTTKCVSRSFAMKRWCTECSFRKGMLHGLHHGRAYLTVVC